MVQSSVGATSNTIIVLHGSPYEGIFLASAKVQTKKEGHNKGNTDQRRCHSDFWGGQSRMAY